MTLLKFDHFTTTPIYVKSNFGVFKRSKNVISGNFGDSELWILVNLRLESCSNLLKSKFRTSKIVKINIFGLFEFPKMWFHVKKSGSKMIKFQQSQAFTSHFESLWSKVKYKSWFHEIFHPKKIFSWHQFNFLEFFTFDFYRKWVWKIQDFSVTQILREINLPFLNLWILLIR